MSNSLEFLSREDIGDYDIASINDNYISISFEPGTGGVISGYPYEYILEDYLLRVWYL